MLIAVVSALPNTDGGPDWPAPGAPIEVPDAEAVRLLNLGVAEAVERRPRPTTRGGEAPTSRA